MTTPQTLTSSAVPTSKGWTIALWVAQGLLAALFLMAGLMKLTQPVDALAQQLPWVTSVPELLVRFIGLAELAGALGLVLPAALRVQPRLTVLAALGLVAVMVLATLFHVTRGELSVVPMNVVIAAHAGFVAWGRTRKAPIAPRA